MRKLMSFVCVIIILSGSTNVYAEEVMPCATNILSLHSAIVESGGRHIVGEVSGAFTGEGLHAIYTCNIQYLSGSGTWINVNDGHNFRAYDPGMLESFQDFYYGQIGTQYRYHVYMRVVDKEGNIWDADVINSIVITCHG